MKHIIISIFALMTLVGVLSCYTQRPLSNKKADNNKTYRVEYLFEHDGCKVYRFMDKGEYIYFTNCNGDVTSFTSDSTHARITNHVWVKEQK